MALFLEILDGALKGTRTRLHDGLVIGREKAHLTIRDSKLSAKHARVESRPDGSYWLIDLDSSNGIKTADDRVRELALTVGAQFILGRTPIQVITFEQSSEDDQTSIPTAIGAVAVTRTFWDHLLDLVTRTRVGARNNPKEVQAFSPPLRMRFTRGFQTGTEWTIGYGPRSVGSGSMDLRLEDSKLPDICFRLVPQSSGPLLTSNAVGVVLLNGAPVVNAMLKNGDTIEISDTRMQVVIEEQSGPA